MQKEPKENLIVLKEFSIISEDFLCDAPTSFTYWITLTFVGGQTC